MRPSDDGLRGARWQWMFVLAVAVAVAVLLTEVVGTDRPSTSPARPELASTPAEASIGEFPSCPEPGDGWPAASLAGVAVGCLGSAARIDLGAALAGQPALINLWASWCGPCRAEIPVLDAYAAQPDAIRVVGMNVQDRPAAAAALFAELGARYPSFIDATAATQAALGAPPVLPITYLLRADGSLTRITDPSVFDDPDQIRAAITAAR